MFFILYTILSKVGNGTKEVEKHWSRVSALCKRHWSIWWWWCVACVCCCSDFASFFTAHIPCQQTAPAFQHLPKFSAFIFLIFFSFITFCGNIVKLFKSALHCCWHSNKKVFAFSSFCHCYDCQHKVFEHTCKRILWHLSYKAPSVK